MLFWILKKYYQTISQEGIWPYVILLNLKIYRIRGKRPSKKKSYRLWKKNRDLLHILYEKHYSFWLNAVHISWIHT